MTSHVRHSEPGSVISDCLVSDGTFQNELNADNPLGMGGKLAVSFAQLMKVLWSGKHYSYAPAKLKVLHIIR